MRRFLAIVAVLAGVTAASSSAATPHGPLTGTWKGVLTGTVNGVTKQQQITFTINGGQTAGTWKVRPNCHGTLTLDSISNGYHHYLRHIASGSTCAGGDVDCLKRVGTKMFDAVTPRPHGWGRSGTLHRFTTM
jgi:hypothetical protein